MEKINKSSVGQLSLDQIVDIVPGIYKEKDNYRSVWDVWLHATHHAAAIGEELRKYKPGKELLKEIAYFSMWLFTFAGKIKGTFDDLEGSIDKNRRVGELTIRTEKEFSDIVWNKYPGICPICFWRRFKNGYQDFERPCDCLLFNIEDRNIVEGEEEKRKKEKDEKERVKALRNYADVQRKLNKKPKTIDDWQKMFRIIYEANLRQISLVDIGFHLLEEVGEVSDAMVRMYSYSDTLDKKPRWNQIWLEEEIADVFSWLLTLTNGLQIMLDITEEFLEYHKVADIFRINEHPIMLSQIIWYKYGSEEQEKFWCATCGRVPCECNLILIGENINYEVFLMNTKDDPLA